MKLYHFLVLIVVPFLILCSFLATAIVTISVPVMSRHESVLNLFFTSPHKLLLMLLVVFVIFDVCTSYICF